MKELDEKLLFSGYKRAHCLNKAIHKNQFIL